MSARPSRVAAAVSSLALGCGLAISGCIIDLGGDDDTTCSFGPPAAPAIALTLVVDPQSLACVEITYCGCGPCPPTDPTEPQESWGACQSQCTGLDVNACDDATGCRAAWDNTCLLTDQPCTLPDPYYGCFAIDTADRPAGACTGLDAFQCARRDDCAATYQRDARCSNARDDDNDTIVDEPDECLGFAACIDEVRR